ncbi:hypothetical protein GOODEAATRI_013600 [Goodea atripinnis]|uniref:Talin 2 n=1 Tax=Goodea atripinnis TaxID=208336 RepID=A0ABV0PXS8_9TELE
MQPQRHISQHNVWCSSELSRLCGFTLILTENPQPVYRTCSAFCYPFLQFHTNRMFHSVYAFLQDFGEYQESYYSVQTTEGEQISQLIAGYIDIILKKKQSKDRFGLEGDEESTMLEESQQFNRVGQVNQSSVALPGVIRSGSIGTESLSMGTMPSAQQQITMGQMHRDPTDTDYTAVGCAITTISSNLTEMSKGVKLLAALMEDDVGGGNDLMKAARTLAGAVSDLLKAVEPTSGEDILMNLAKAVANAAAMLVLKAKNVAQVAEDTVLQNRVIAAATQCALSTSQLVACAKVVSPTISSPVCQEQLIEAGKLVDRSVESCVQACLSATEDGELLKQVSVAASVVSQALADLLQHVRQYTARGEPIGRYDQATDTIMNVTESIFSSMGDAGEMVRQARVLAQATSDLVNAMRSDAEVEVDVDNSKKLLAAAKLLADATARMVEAAKGAAAYPENEDQQQRLREAAEGLRVATNAAAQNAIKKKLINRLEAVADHIPQLVQGVRGSQAKPEDLSAQLALIIASQNFLQDLGSTSKAVGSSMAQLLTCAAQGNEHYTGWFWIAARETAQALKTLAQAARGVAASTMDPKAAAAMLDSARDVMEGSAVLIHEAKQALMSDGDAESQQRLAQVAKAVSHSLNNCVNCLPGQKDVDMALKSIGEASKKLLIETIPLASKSFQEAQNDLTQTAADLNQSAATIVAKHTSALCNACRLASSKTTNPVAKRHFVQSAKEVANTTANLVKTIKALDGDFSEENRNRCRVATAPLIEAVENLTTFASNPEFASVPAKISNEEPILQSARSMLDSSTHLLKTARSLVINPKDPPTWSVLAGHSRTVSDSIKSLITAIRDKAPGQRECDSSIDNINKCIRDIEQASLAAISQNLPSRDDISLEALQEQLTSTVQEIGHLIDPVSTAARGEASQLGHKVCGPETLIAGAME